MFSGSLSLVYTLFAAFSNLVITPAQIIYLIFYILMAVAPMRTDVTLFLGGSIQKLLYFKHHKVTLKARLGFIHAGEWAQCPKSR